MFHNEFHEQNPHEMEKQCRLFRIFVHTPGMEPNDFLSYHTVK